VISYAQVFAFTGEEIEAFRAASKMVDAIPSHPRLARTLRCHEVARAVSSILGLEVRDGLYARTQHSWLLTPAGNILDVYSVGRLPVVQLVDSRAISLQAHSGLYVEGLERDDIDGDVVRFLVMFMKGDAYGDVIDRFVGLVTRSR
jgi:hypothetical protein